MTSLCLALDRLLTLILKRKKRFNRQKQRRHFMILRSQRARQTQILLVSKSIKHVNRQKQQRHLTILLFHKARQTWTLLVSKLIKHVNRLKHLKMQSLRTHLQMMSQTKIRKTTSTSRSKQWNECWSVNQTSIIKFLKWMIHSQNRRSKKRIRSSHCFYTQTRTSMKMLKRLLEVNKALLSRSKLFWNSHFYSISLQNWLHNINVNTTVKALDVETEKFSENAYEDDEDNDNHSMKVEQSESKSDDFCKQIYEQVTSHLRKLMNDLDNKVAQLELKKLNEQIKQRNVKNKLLKNNLDDFLINIFMFIANFKNAKRFIEALKKNSTNNIAREKLIKINQYMNLVNEQRNYLRKWLIIISSHSDTNAAEFKSETSEESFRSMKDIKVIKKDDQAFIKDDVKIKVSVSISDESDDWTSFEKVMIVRSTDFDSRVIVNHEIDMNSYYNIHLEVTFEKEIAWQWLNEKTYEIANSSNDIVIDELKICERVKIAHIATTLLKRVERQSQNHNNICYYFIKIQEKSYLSIRTALSEMKRISLVKLKWINAALNH